MPQLDISTWPSQIFWLAITFLALFFVISRVAIPRTGGVIEKRKSTIAGDLARAQNLKAEVDATVKTYEAALADSRAKAHAIALENRNRLNAEVEAERHKLDAELGGKIATAEKQVAASRAKAMADVQSAAADVVAAIVSELIGAKVTREAAADAVAKAAK